MPGLSWGNMRVSSRACGDGRLSSKMIWTRAGPSQVTGTGMPPLATAFSE